MQHERNYYFDNLKSLLIFLVVITHGMEYVYSTHSKLRAISIIVYSFHMPLFVFVSGYFAKLSSKSNKSKFINTIKIYLIAQFLYNLLYFYVFKPKNYSFTFVYANWTLWYLLSLAFWYIISDYITDFKKGLIIAFILSLVIGFDKHIEAYISLSRTIGFLPYFLIGYYFDTKYLKYIEKYKLQLITLLFISVGVLYSLRNVIDIRMFFNSYAYKQFGSDLFKGFYLRLLSYPIAFIMSLGIMACIPKTKNLFSYFGKITLYIYLVHSGVIRLMYYFKIYKSSTRLETITTFTIMIVITYTLAIILMYIINLMKSIKQSTVKQQEQN